MAKLPLQHFMTHIYKEDREYLANARKHFENEPHIEHETDAHVVFHDVNRTCPLCGDKVEMKGITE